MMRRSLWPPCHQSIGRSRQPRSHRVPISTRAFTTTPTTRANWSPTQTLTEKIVQRYAVGLPKDKVLRSGDYISLEPAACMTHDNTFPVSVKFDSMGATKIHNPKQLVFTIDHDVQNSSEKNLKKYKAIEELAKLHGVAFSGAKMGIGHQVMVQDGHAWPGTMAVASDSHSNHYGGVGCLGTPVVRSDAASVWATGRTWWQVPPVVKITFTGVLPVGVTGKDVIVALCGLFGNEVLNHCIEFTGSEETMASLPVDYRLTIANMTTEFGALTGLFPIDGTLKRWLKGKASEASMLDHPRQARINHERIDELYAERLTADSDAVYAKQLYLNLSTLSPHVSGPNSVKVATPLNDLAQKNIKIQKAYLVSCTNSRASDIAAAAEVVRQATEANGGVTPKVADGVQLYIAAASVEEQEAAEAVGDWQLLVEAGARPLPSGCGPCIGLGEGLVEAGEKCISASNRNFVGRMGSRESEAYLASPEVVAASALSGQISGPNWYQTPANYAGVEYGFGSGLAPSPESELESLVQQLDSLIERVETSETASESTVEVLEGFPEKISGEIVFLDADNLNTDAIYPGKLTYQDNLPKETMAEACMQNYDPKFKDIAKPNDIIVSGFNFGCGSSREQAATAILAKGIPLVVSGSFGNIFSRNSINNGLLGLEIPRLIEKLRAQFSDKQTTRRTGWTLTWDVKRSMVEVTEGEGGETWTEKVGEVPPNVQDIMKEGLEAWVRKEIAAR